MSDYADITVARSERYFVATGMERYGGGFVKKLGVALWNADDNNVLKIKHTWPEYWAEYLRIGEGLEDRSLTLTELELLKNKGKGIPLGTPKEDQQ